MTLILSNEDVAAVLTMPRSLSVIREMYGALDRGTALTRPRSDLVAAAGDATYSLKTQDGLMPEVGLSAVRINSDLLQWPEAESGARRVKLPRAGGRWVGLVILFDVTSGTPLALFPDGVAQRIRVACTSALAARVLAREEADVVAVLGTGWQAETQVTALCAAMEPRELREIRCFSPTRENRVEFARRLSETTGRPVVARNSADEAVAGADVVLCATNAIHPVVQPDWVREGVHIGTIKPPEVSSALIKAFDVAVVHAAAAIPKVIAQEGLEWRESEALNPDLPREADLAGLPDLAGVLTGTCPGRTSDGQSTLFVNNGGLGVQFAALGSLILAGARDLGLGTDFPDDWFTQDVHP